MEMEKKALDVRCSLVQFTEMFDADTHVFPFDVYDWARALLFMAENFS